MVPSYPAKMNVSDVLKLKFDAIRALARRVPAMVKDVLRSARRRNTPLEHLARVEREGINARQLLAR